MADRINSTTDNCDIETFNTILKNKIRANAAGFGFVSIDADEPDVFIGRGQTGFALDGDEVFIEAVKWSKCSASSEAKVLTKTL